MFHMSWEIGLNCTFMELKFWDPYPKRVIKLCLNCTFMELKYYSKKD